MENPDWQEPEEEMIEQDIYSEIARESLLDEDIINAEEAAFMKGWDEAGIR